ncbi:NUDIX hydrolase [Halorarum halobium]|uniref:NUDIX hydrolase n=1 Tax=Halorarum halobium TaxID=3075121 RepID=UPI0028A8BABF|nr:NUDIX domain-containing protein [Halobaculum sp. XH14]
MTDRPLRATISLRGIIRDGGGDVLVVRRASDGEWELPGGRLDHDEDAVPGLEREIAEETGLTVDVGPPVHATAWRNDDDRGRFGVYYPCTTEVRTVSLSGEHVEYAWDDAATAADRLGAAGACAVERATDDAVRAAPASVELR